MQIFDLDKKAKVKTHLATEEINFWNWINPDTIGIVTESNVFHWSLNGIFFNLDCKFNNIR